MGEFIASFIGELLGGILLPLIGAPVRWLCFFGQKPWKEIWEDKYSYNPIVGIAVIIIFLLVLLFQFQAN